MKRIIHSIPLIPIAVTVPVIAVTSCSNKQELITLSNTVIESSKAFGLDTTLNNGKSYSINATLKNWNVEHGKPNRTDWSDKKYNRVVIHILSLEKPKEEFIKLDNIKVKLNDKYLEQSSEGGGYSYIYNPDTNEGLINIFDTNSTTKVPYDGTIVIENIECKETQKVAIWTKRA